RGAISFTDLPAAAQEKLMARQSLRDRSNSVNLMSEDGVI
ncbi:MAG: tryptophan synthase subunit beta like protein, partial [Halomonadaceae bacterium]|nr:tryptophan synthase subunit beta like protein [Halomonadaceae bacterium]